ncbi:MAG TPA: BON domain-containing protein [Candidatus Polarisedimenticolia bacterium]|nr:BON domain-containing protein [Candidatus Polarisedimenticolia bacterium]
MKRQTLTCALVALALSLPVAAHAASRPDSWITMKAKTALYLADDVQGSAINVDTINGRVSLFGKVRSEQEKAKAASEVRKVEGVTDVKNYLQVVPPANEKRVERSDDAIKSDIESALKSDRVLDNSSISVKSVNKGVVLLSGKAASWNDNVRALHIASGKPGVVRLVSEIEVRDEIADGDFRLDSDAKPAAGAKPDAKQGVGGVMGDLWITSAAKMKLAADSRTPATEINVDTVDGTVTLFGMVPTKESKAAAQEVVQGVSGVKHVENNLEIVTQERQDVVQAKDEEVQENVKKALKDRGDQENASIGVEVSNGVVRLTGKVPTWERSLSAVYSARSVQGVRSVRNDMTVETQQAAR